LSRGKPTLGPGNVPVDPPHFNLLLSKLLHSVFKYGRTTSKGAPAFSQSQSVAQQGYPAPGANNIFALPPTKSVSTSIKDFITRTVAL